jgi:hypothetical protein
VNGGRSHLHEPASRGAGESLHARIPILHNAINVRCLPQLQMLRGLNGSFEAVAGMRRLVK